MRLRRLQWIYTEHPIFYVTLVAHNRRNLFANPAVHEALVEFGQKAMVRGVAIGRYVLMPDHLHLFAAFAPSAIDLSSWIRSLKNSLSKCLRRSRIPPPHWQKGFLDHVLRSEESYRQK